MRQKWWTFDRSDYVVLRLLLLVAVAVAAIGPVSSLADWARGRPLTWRSGASVAPPLVDEPLAMGASGRWADLAQWTIPAPSAAQRFGALLPSLWALLVLALVVWSSWRLLNAVQRDAAFSDVTVRASRVLGVAMLSYVALGWFVRLVADLLVMGPLRDSLMVTARFDGADLALALTGFLVVALGEVFRQGRRLAEDTQGLV